MPLGLLGILVLILVASGGADRHPFRQGGDGHGPGARGAGGLVNRRGFLFSPLLIYPGIAFAENTKYPRSQARARNSQFPRDHGAHPEYRIEWWYVTGWLDGPLGFQITFFRARPEEESANPSSFNPRQILFAHAALVRPEARPAAARPARGARRLLARACRDSTAPASGSTTGSSSSRATATRRASRRAISISILRCSPADLVLQGEARLQPQGPPARGGQLLLQPPAAQRRRQGERPAT